MVKPELGTKRSCPSCHSRFYDLNRDPIVCPKCGTSFFAEALLPSKAEHAQPAPKPVPAEQEPAETEDVELVSLEDVKEDGADDEAAGIEDVELDEQAEDIGTEDAFLEEEEEAEPGVGNLIGGGKAGEEEP